MRSGSVAKPVEAWFNSCLTNYRRVLGAATSYRIVTAHTVQCCIWQCEDVLCAAVLCGMASSRRGALNFLALVFGILFNCVLANWWWVHDINLYFTYYFIMEIIQVVFRLILMQIYVCCNSRNVNKYVYLKDKLQKLLQITLYTKINVSCHTSTSSAVK